MIHGNLGVAASLHDRSPGCVRDGRLFEFDRDLLDSAGFPLDHVDFHAFMGALGQEFAIEYLIEHFGYLGLSFVYECLDELRRVN